MGQTLDCFCKSIASINQKCEPNLRLASLYEMHIRRKLYRFSHSNRLQPLSRIK